MKYLASRIATLQSQISLRDIENGLALQARDTVPLATAAGAPARQIVPPLARKLAVKPVELYHNVNGIWSVNGHEKSFTMTPGAYVTINGKAFGDTVGQVNMFLKTAIPLQVFSWSDSQIYALLPAGIRGQTDQPARLQVITRAGQTYTTSNANFYAEREEITLTSNLSRVIQFIPAANWPTTLEDNGLVDRTVVRDDLTCASPSQDTLRFPRMPKGFDVTGIYVQFMGRTDTGDGDGSGHSGNHIYSPGYDIGDWQEQNGVSTIAVLWGVWRSHRSRDVTIPASDMCSSAYQVQISVAGPAGVSPF